MGGKQGGGGGGRGMPGRQETGEVPLPSLSSFSSTVHATPLMRGTMRPGRLPSNMLGVAGAAFWPPASLPPAPWDGEGRLPGRVELEVSGQTALLPWAIQLVSRPGQLVGEVASPFPSNGQALPISLRQEDHEWSCPDMFFHPALSCNMQEVPHARCHQS